MRLFLILCLFLVSFPAAAAKVAVNWTDLPDPGSTIFEDPFTTLSIAELRSLGTVLRLRSELEQTTLSANSAAQTRERLQREEAKLAASGVRTDWLLSQRHEIGKKRAKAALAGNPDLDGQEIVISGYAIPVFAPGTKTVTGGYLVPEAGMCSHMPAPDPNQMIRYQVEEGLNAEEIYQPVQMVGRLSLRTTRQEITLLDGQVDMIAAFDMDVSEIRNMDRPARSSGNRLLNFFTGRKVTSHQ